jgi:methionine synthase II (cobalamin-independent)
MLEPMKQDLKMACADRVGCLPRAKWLRAEHRGFENGEMDAEEPEHAHQ